MPRPTALLSTETGAIEYLVTRSGEPTTVYGHGLLGSIDEARPFASGVTGTAVFLRFRGHGRTSALDGRWDYAAVAGELNAIADEVGATQALGVSLGAGAMLRLLTVTPRRFRRLAFVLPPPLPGHRDPAAAGAWTAMADLVVAKDADGLAAALLDAQPAPVRTLPQAATYYARLARGLVNEPGDVVTALRTFPTADPVEDLAALQRVEAPALVIGQRDDPLHPVESAAALAGALPNGKLHVLGRPGALWLDRAELRDVLSGFLG
ncbi:MAG TPA: alpha/beta hydrolase [Streptosporangiales bacterium]